MTPWNSPTETEIIDMAIAMRDAGFQLSPLMARGELDPSQVSTALVFVVLQERARQCGVELIPPEGCEVHFTDEHGNLMTPSRGLPS